jgi:hypothetical protein
MLSVLMLMLLDPKCCWEMLLCWQLLVATVAGIVAGLVVS